MSISMTHWGALPAVQVRAADGAQATVTLFGGHLLSWTSADGAEQLFCSEQSALDGSRAIRGGVPVIFPQFAERGHGMRHGFARLCTWRVLDSGVQEDGAAFGVFTLDDTDLSEAQAQQWPHRFALTLTVAVLANALTLNLEVRNSGLDAFAFSSALHTYFLVDQLDRVRIDGLQHDALAIDDKHDMIYRVNGPVVLSDGVRCLQLAQSGFTDMVVWNPGAADAQALADLADAEYQHFVCVEPALIEPLELAAGAVWRGEHHLLASSIP
jgi:glucose-6-phosphate 1-epimerase